MFFPKWGLSGCGYQMESEAVLTALAEILNMLDVIIDKATGQTLSNKDDKADFSKKNQLTF